MSKPLRIVFMVIGLACFGGSQTIHGQASGVPGLNHEVLDGGCGSTYPKGMSTDFTGQSAADVKRRMDRLKEIGVGWLRMDFDWSQIQPNGPAEFEVRQLDDIVRSAGRHGIHILGLITYAPPWANDHAPNQFYPPTKASDFGSFAGYLANRYGPMGVHSWEIWNEPNLGAVFWYPKAQPAEYTKLLKVAYVAIKAADPKATVVTGGMSDACDCDASLTPMTFLSGIYKEGGQPYFDALGDHPYTYPALPNASDGSAYWWTQMFTGQDNLRSIMALHDDRDKKIWMTEFGAPTNGGADDVTESKQAQLVTVAYQLHATYPWAGPLFWYTYQDSGTDPTNEENWYGIVRFDGTHKPSYAAYEAVDPCKAKE